MHPMNDAILAYCDTKAEAEYVRDAINRVCSDAKKALGGHS